MTDKTNKRII